MEDERVRTARLHCVQADGWCFCRLRALCREFALEVPRAEVNDPVIEVLAAKMYVTCSGLHLEDAILSCVQL